MTLENRYRLSCYEEVSKLEENKNIWLVRNNEDDNFYVKKRIEIYNKSVYLRLKQGNYANVPKVIMCEEDDGKLIVLEEYIHGVSLEKQLKQDGAFELQEVLKIMIALCDILSVLHKSSPPIIHRDIKPSNIMKSSDGIIKLVDFNAAKEFTDGREEDTRLMGTREYAAPEQYGFGPSDPRTDIYALGITMYYLRYMKYPKNINPSDDFCKLVKQCTALDKNDRYQTVDELKEELQQLLKETLQMNGQGSEERWDLAEPSKSFNKRDSRLPVGFRSGTVWKMICACFGYLFLFWIALSADVNDAKGNALSGYPLWANRVALLIIMLGAVAFFGNYCNIRYQLPFMRKNKMLHFFLCGVYYSLFFIMVIILLIILGGG